MAKLLITFCVLFFPAMAFAGQQSICYGSTKNGELKNGVKLPAAGNNFISYGTLPGLAGRTYVHSTVRDIVVGAYKMLEATHPGKVFKYAETGFESGGLFKPHKTHQNGLSVDFMVPVVNAAGQSVHLPTHPLNKYGYNIEFDNKGHYDNLKIDFETLAAHMVALHKAAAAKTVAIRRIIFDPALQPFLFATGNGAYLRAHINMPKKPSWVRHDEHYHVDFDIACRPLP